MEKTCAQNKAKCNEPVEEIVQKELREDQEASPAESIEKKRESEQVDDEVDQIESVQSEVDDLEEIVEIQEKQSFLELELHRAQIAEEQVQSQETRPPERTQEPEEREIAVERQEKNWRVGFSMLDENKEQKVGSLQKERFQNQKKRTEKCGELGEFFRLVGRFV